MSGNDKVVRCYCDDWCKSFEQIASAQFVASAHGMMYTGKTFEYCPWCGRKLEIVDDEN